MRARLADVGVIPEGETLVEIPRELLRFAGQPMGHDPRPGDGGGSRLTLLLGDAFNALFESFSSTARRLEVRERYNVEDEREPLRAYLDGQPDDLAWFAPWLDQIRRLTGSGRQFRRVRVVSVPLSDYSRWGLDIARHTSAAGEDIRYLDRADASDLPSFDYWLFDDSRAARLHFDADDRPLGGEIITDRGKVNELAAALTTAEDRAVSRTEFARARGLR